MVCIYVCRIVWYRVLRRLLVLVRHVIKTKLMSQHLSCTHGYALQLSVLNKGCLHVECRERQTAPEVVVLAEATQTNYNDCQWGTLTSVDKTSSRRSELNKQM